MLSIRKDSESDQNYIYCSSCKKDIKCYQKSHIVQHINSVLHKNSINDYKENRDITQNEFNSDLCDLLVSLNIPLSKVEDKRFKQFCEKYTEFKAQNRQYLSDKHLPELYEKTIIA